jgi:hypothetical protein
MHLHSLSHRFRNFCVTAFSFLTFLSFSGSAFSQTPEDLPPPSLLESSAVMTAPLKLVSLLEAPIQSLVQRFKPSSPPVSVLINPSDEMLVVTQGQLKPSIAIQRIQTQQALKQHLQDTYSVEDTMAQEVVMSAFQAGQKYNIDPLLLLAVMKVESTFNPRAVSPANAKGLMQVLPQAHPEKIAAVGGVHQLFVPQINIKMGAQILRDCLDRAGTMAKALQFYNGSPYDAKQKYANKVLTARQEFARTELLALATPR